MTRIEDELQQFFDRVATDVDMAPDLPGRLHARARRRVRTRRLAGAGIGMAAVVAAVALAVPTLRDDTSNIEVVPAPAPTVPTPQPTAPAPTVKTGSGYSWPATIVTAREKGRALAVVDTRTGVVQRTLHRLPSGQTVQDVSVSPDGTTVWFQVHTGTQCKEVVYTAPFAGGPVRRTTAGRSPEVSPDGRFVAYLAPASEHGGPAHPSAYLCDGALVVRDLRTGAERAWIATADPTGHLGQPAWSRDGSRIALSYDGTNTDDDGAADWTTQIRVLDVARTGTLEQASQVVAESRGPSVGPGGPPRPDDPVWLHDERLAFVRTENAEENPTFGSRVVVLEEGTERDLLGRVPGRVDLHADSTGRHLLATNVRGMDPAGMYRFIGIDTEGGSEQLQTGLTSAEYWIPAADW